MNRNSGAAKQYDVYHHQHETEYMYPETQPYTETKTVKYRRKQIRRVSRSRVKQALGTTYVKALAVCVIYGIIMVVLCAQGSMLSYDIIQLKSDIADLETDNKRLNFEIEKKSSPDRIAAIAVNQLGMVMPDMSKAYYMTENIKPAQISSVLEEDTVAAPQQTGMQRIYAFLKELGSKAVKSGINLLASY